MAGSCTNCAPGSRVSGISIGSYRDHAATIAAASLGAPLQERLLSGEPVKSAGRRTGIAPQHPFRSPIPCCRWRCATAGRKRGICWRNACSFPGTSGRDVLCAYVKNAGRSETKWVGSCRVPRRRGRHVHAHHYQRPPDCLEDSSVLYEPRGCGSIWNRGSEPRTGTAPRKEAVPLEHSALRFPWCSLQLKKSENAHQPTVHNHILGQCKKLTNAEPMTPKAKQKGTAGTNEPFFIPPPRELGKDA